MLHKNQMIYAIKNDKLVNIEDVESGLKCGCICPSCSKPLIARKGNKKIHHFAHRSSDNCAYGYQTSLHLLAKEIIATSKKFVIPEVSIHFHSYKEGEIISNAKEIKIDKVELEKTFDSIIPDIVIYSGGKKLFVEIFVTHQIDDQKLAKLKKANISTIEIDLSKINRLITRQELTDILLNDTPEKKWKYNAVLSKYERLFFHYAVKIQTVHHGFAWHTAYCPIGKRIWRNKTYANILDDCTICDFCFWITDGDDEFDENRVVFCLGESLVSSIDDIKKELSSKK